MKNLAIIPAREGSKRVKDKNIRLLCGKPMLLYSVEAALASGEFSEVMVSTDSQRYAQIARSGGASVPFLRSAATSSDTASSADMIMEVLSFYESRGERFDTFCLLQPTSPLRTAEDIRSAYAVYREKDALSVVSVCEAEHPPTWMNHLPEDQSLVGFLSRDCSGNKGKYYRLNGAVYIADTKQYETERDFYKSRSFAYVMPQERSVDIDTETDYRMAEFFAGLENMPGAVV